MLRVANENNIVHINRSILKLYIYIYIYNNELKANILKLVFIII